MDNIIQQIIEILRSYPCVRRAILFGSRARGDFQGRSDYDIAIDCPQATDKQWLAIIDSINHVNTLLKIDVVRYDQSSEALKEKVDKEGRIIYEQ